MSLEGIEIHASSVTLVLWKTDSRAASRNVTLSMWVELGTAGLDSDEFMARRNASSHGLARVGATWSASLQSLPGQNMVWAQLLLQEGFLDVSLGQTDSRQSSGSRCSEASSKSSPDTRSQLQAECMDNTGVRKCKDYCPESLPRVFALLQMDLLLTSSGVPGGSYNSSVVIAFAHLGLSSAVQVELTVRAETVASRCTVDGYVGDALSRFVDRPLPFQLTARDIDGLAVDHAGDTFVAVLIEDEVTSGSGELVSGVYRGDGKYLFIMTIDSTAVSNRTRYAGVQAWRCDNPITNTDGVAWRHPAMADTDRLSSNLLNRTLTGVAGATCTSLPLVTFANVPLQPDWWRIDAISIDSRECTKGNCPNHNGSSSCAVGRTGVLCAACAGGYYRSGQRCVDCGDAGGVIFASGVVVCLGLLVLTLFLGSCFGAGLLSRPKASRAVTEKAVQSIERVAPGIEEALGEEAGCGGISLEEEMRMGDTVERQILSARLMQATRNSFASFCMALASRWPRPKWPQLLEIGLPKAKILVSLYQVVSGLDYTFDFKYPDIFRRLLDMLTFWEFSLPDLGCAVILDFHGVLAFHTCMPIAALLVIAWQYFITVRSEQLLDQADPWPEAPLASDVAGKAAPPSTLPSPSSPPPPILPTPPRRRPAPSAYPPAHATKVPEAARQNRDILFGTLLTKILVSLEVLLLPFDAAGCYCSSVRRCRERTRAAAGRAFRRAEAAMQASDSSLGVSHSRQDADESSAIRLAFARLRNTLMTMSVSKSLALKSAPQDEFGAGCLLGPIGASGAQRYWNAIGVESDAEG